MTTSDSIVVGSHQWSLVERVRSGVTFLGGVVLLVAANVFHERWLTLVGVTLLAAFAYVAATSGRVVHITRDRLETVSPLGPRALHAVAIAHPQVLAYFIPIHLPNLRCLPDLVVGIPVALENFRNSHVTPNARFQEKVIPGPSFITNSLRKI